MAMCHGGFICMRDIANNMLCALKRNLGNNVEPMGATLITNMP